MASEQQLLQFEPRICTACMCMMFSKWSVQLYLSKRCHNTKLEREQDQLSMKIRFLSSFSDTSPLSSLKSNSLTLINLLTILSCWQGAASSTGTQLHHHKRYTSINTQSSDSLRSYSFCSALTEAASMWQQVLGGQGGCQSHRWNDRHNRHLHSYWTSEHHHMSTPTHRHRSADWVQVL